MTTREKNLLTVLGIAFFIILNFVAYLKFYEPEVQKSIGAKNEAENKLKQAQFILSKKDSLEADRRWLEGTGEVFTTPQLAQSQLQALIRKQADARNLDTRDERIESYIPGDYYDRVRVTYKATGMEDRIQQWLLSIHQPNQRQVITRLELKPQSNDLTRVECTVEVEKWIIIAEDSDLL
ncbi:MAG: hypothetical protein QNL33_14000 [Akkermansiaceae bacterium]|jgi:hypothetical protein